MWQRAKRQLQITVLYSTTVVKVRLYLSLVYKMKGRLGEPGA